MLQKLKAAKWKHYINYVVIGAIGLVYTILALSGGLKSSTTMLLEKVSISVIAAVSLSLVVGFLGELSLGHAGFMCIGAYLGGKVSALLEPVLGRSNMLLNFIIALIVGGVCAAVFGAIIGLPALRLKGDYLAIVTLAFGEIVKVIFQQSKTFGANLGLPTPRYNKDYFFIICFVMILATLAVSQNLIRSKHGRAITSIRDNEIAAKATGINVTRYKLTVFTISAFFAGVAGVLFSFSNNTVQSVKFGYNYSIEILVMVVLGGMGSINGSIIAAALITYLNIKLQTVLTGDQAVLKDFFYALILILVVIYNNAPALQGFREKYNFKALVAKFKKPRHDPSVIKDDESKWDRVPSKIKMDALLSVDLTNKTDKPDEEDK